MRATPATPSSRAGSRAGECPPSGGPGGEQLALQQRHQHVGASTRERPARTSRRPRAGGSTRRRPARREDRERRHDRDRDLLGEDRDADRDARSATPARSVTRPHEQVEAERASRRSRRCRAGSGGGRRSRTSRARTAQAASTPTQVLPDARAADRQHEQRRADLVEEHQHATGGERVAEAVVEGEQLPDRRSGSSRAARGRRCRCRAASRPRWKTAQPCEK